MQWLGQLSPNTGGPRSTSPTLMAYTIIDTAQPAQADDKAIPSFPYFALQCNTIE